MKEWVERGQLVVVGRIQEQHPERCRLFMQWQQMDFPILVDPLNLLGLNAVPVVTCIDEQGVARPVPSQEVAAAFVERDAVRAGRPVVPADSGVRAGSADGDPESSSAIRAVALEPPRKPDLGALQRAAATGDAEAWGEYGAALYLWGGADRIDAAVEAFRRAVDLAENEGRWHFRLGVCLRGRHESDHRRPDDFQEAIIEWGRALELDPNQYIWRRRIQQYGPRLDKPYPFYDWVYQARAEIEGRGEIPTTLAIEPAGAEYAEPLTEPLAEAAAENPDPQGRVWRDELPLVDVEVVCVPAAIRPGGAARVHLLFRPNRAARAHWNNEADDLQIWVDPLPGWDVARRLFAVSGPLDPVSTETRQLDLELQCDTSTEPGLFALPAYALYYVCEDVDGTCLFKRQDIEIAVRVVE